MAVTTPAVAQVRNWFGSIPSAPAIVVYPRSVDEIAQIYSVAAKAQPPRCELPKPSLRYLPHDVAMHSRSALGC
jgi:hypothetical protein